MAADIVFTTVALPPAFIGQAYEAAIAYKAAASAVTAQSISVGHLPTGLALDTFASAPGSLRITGTPTGKANATPQAGVGTYSFTVSCTDTGGAVTQAYTLTVYNSQDDLLIQGGRTSQDGLN